MYEDKKQKNQSGNYSVTCGEQVTLFAAGCTEKWIVPNISGRFFLKENHIYGIILILDQPIDKLSAIISSFCVKLPCQATACLRSLSLTELILSVDFVYRTIEN